jgi:hypothetical protein
MTTIKQDLKPAYICKIRKEPGVLLELESDRDHAAKQFKERQGLQKGPRRLPRQEVGQKKPGLD